MVYDWIIAIAAGAFGGLLAPFIIEKFRSSLVIKQEEIKNQLKKSEFFFGNQYTAAQEFSSFFYSLLPQKHHFTDDWESVMGDLASKLPIHGEYLNRFMEQYSI